MKLMVNFYYKEFFYDKINPLHNSTRNLIDNIK